MQQHTYHAIQGGRLLTRNCDFRLHVMRPAPSAGRVGDTADSESLPGRMARRHNDTHPYRHLYGTDYVERCKEISKLMKISDKLGILNYERYQSFSTPFTNDNALPCIFSFKGDVYEGEFEVADGGKRLVRKGTGRFTSGSDGREYEGGFADDLESGVGTCTFPDGSQYQGEWALGKAEGTGFTVSKPRQVTTGDGDGGGGTNAIAVMWDERSGGRASGGGGRELIRALALANTEIVGGGVGDGCGGRAGGG